LGSGLSRHIFYSFLRSLLGWAPFFSLKTSPHLKWSNVLPEWVKYGRRIFDVDQSTRRTSANENAVTAQLFPPQRVHIQTQGSCSLRCYCRRSSLLPSAKSLNSVCPAGQTTRLGADAKDVQI
jgi:hypothetical protein